ncbi:MAG: nucleotidyl transferase AbiEii/AbiGii toxin family protein [Pleomorphochaeta sp.]
MIKSDSFSYNHIQSLKNKYRLDPSLLERVVYAFGLLEALKKIDLPFIFKGGTCLMLLLEKPMRLSTDIDIIVSPNVNINSYINKISDIYPFKNIEEQIRIGKNNIEKRHFKFTYDSPVSKKEIYILLDILIEDDNYYKVVEKEIINDLLITEGKNYIVQVPSIDCLLADKLIAFAPHTTGITIESGKYMEIMKQMFDTCTLVDYFSNYEDIVESYKTIANQEISYCGISIEKEDILLDTIEVSKNIISRGKYDKDEYEIYKSGIRSLKSHLFDNNYSPNIAAINVTKIFYLTSCILKQKEYKKIEDFQLYRNVTFRDKKYAPLKYLKKINLEAYAYCIESEKVLDE